MGSLPAPGTPAPAFTLPSFAGVDASLPELREDDAVDDALGTWCEIEAILSYLEGHRRSA